MSHYDIWVYLLLLVASYGGCFLSGWMIASAIRRYTKRDAWFYFPWLLAIGFAALGIFAGIHLEEYVR